MLLLFFIFDFIVVYSSAIEYSNDIPAFFKTEYSKAVFQVITTFYITRIAVEVVTSIADSMSHIVHYAMAGVVNEDKCLPLTMSPVIGYLFF